MPRMAEQDDKAPELDFTRIYEMNDWSRWE